jgi:hypothetical protein
MSLAGNATDIDMTTPTDAQNAVNAATQSGSPLINKTIFNSTLTVVVSAIATVSAALAALTLIVNAWNVAGRPIDVKEYGALGTAIYGNDGVTTAGSTTFTCASCNFTAANVGNYIGIDGADTGGHAFVGTIASINSATSVAMSSVSATTVSSARYVFGIDDSANVQAALNVAKNNPRGGKVTLSCGTYLIANPVFIYSNTSFTGFGTCSHIVAGRKGWAVTTFQEGILNIVASVSIPNLYNFEIGNMWETGVWTEDSTIAPKLIYLDTAFPTNSTITNVSIHDMLFEYAAFEGIFDNGGQTNRTNVRVVNNVFNWVGDGPFNSFVGLPSVQGDYAQAFIAFNTFRNVGQGPGAGATKMRVIGNHCEEYTIACIGLGEGNSPELLVVSDNVIISTSTNSAQSYGIIATNGQIAGGTNSLIANNSITLRSGYGIKSQYRSKIIGNALHLVAGGVTPPNGIRIDGDIDSTSFSGSHTIENNTVTVDAGVSSGAAITAAPGGSGFYLNVQSSGNKVWNYGTGYSYYYIANDGGVAVINQKGDWQSGGAMKNNYLVDSGPMQNNFNNVYFDWPPAQYAIGSLPAGFTGREAYITDQLTTCPAPGVAPTPGGSKVCPVVYLGAWVGK